MTEDGVTQPNYEEIAQDHPPEETHITELYRDPTLKALEQRIQVGTGGIVHRFRHPEEYDPPDRFREKGFDAASPMSLSSEVEKLGEKEPRDVFDDLRAGVLEAAKAVTGNFGFNTEFTAEELMTESSDLRSNYKVGTVSDYLRELSEVGILENTGKDGRTNLYTLREPWWKQ